MIITSAKYEMAEDLVCGGIISFSDEVDGRSQDE